MVFDLQEKELLEWEVEQQELMGQQQELEQ
jgi:hypothetical protein